MKEQNHKLSDPRLLIGLDVSDDAAVYQMDEERAIVQTLDFFTPIVDDPYDFGAIAAANALSDLYAMGAKPLFALNILCVPEDIPQEILKGILEGGSAKALEAGIFIAGGHSVYDNEPKYGLAATGELLIKDLLKKSNGLAGDLLVLTKPLGTGIIANAEKGEAEILSTLKKEAILSMKKLNKRAMELLKEFEIRGCTDVTGFGLAGHGMEIAQKSGLGLTLYHDKMPFFAGSDKIAETQKLAGGILRNRNSYQEIELKGKASKIHELFAFSPETSGGLLATVPEKDINSILKRFEDEGEFCAVVGELTSELSYEIR